MKKQIHAADAAVMKNKLPSCISWKGRGTELITDGKKTVLDTDPVSYLESLTLQHCSTLEGRTDAFRTLMHVSQKPCILISERSQDIYFPTMGMDNPECQWFLYSDIAGAKEKDAHHTSVLLYSGEELVANVNIRTIRKQLARCHDFLILINPV